ncbi:extracellular calcium-sensing receptor [Astyanax mexicanus]|uniref:extracellular calcium-sensing receptor n=1 Tax=Astyanax mexicanus TaxID=7994 RepID=UPI0020CACADD|nr:extracellular calcium-sensing receptor [Astyanax mexicanus]
MPGNMPVCALVLLTFFLFLLPLVECGSACQRLGEFVPQVLETDGDVIIGGLFPLHYIASEPDHDFTAQAQSTTCTGFDLRAFRWVQTMVFAIEEINRNTTLLPGVTLGYRILDSCDHVHTSLQSALSLVNGSSAFQTDQSAASRPQCLSRAPVPAVIGLASSTPTRAVADIFGPFEIPLISYFATCTCLTDKRVYPSFLRTVPSDIFQVQALVQLMADFDWRWVGTLGTDEDYSRYGIQAFTEQLEAWGGCVAFHHTIPKVPTPKQIGAIVDALEVSTARVIVVFATEGQLLDLLLEVARRNLTGLQWVASEAWVTATILTTPELQHVLSGTLGFSFRGANISGLAEFLLTVRPSPSPGSAFTNQFWEEQFGCRLTYGDSEDLGRPFCSGLEDLKLVDSSYTNAIPVRVSYNVYKGVYAIAHALHSLLQCTPVGSDKIGCNTGSEFTPGQLLHHLKSVNFTNQFEEKVYFDHNGEPVPLYDMINWQRNGRGGIRFQTVGGYDGSAPLGQQLIMDRNSIEWTGRQSQVPVSLCTSSCPPGTRKATRPGQPVCCFDCLPCAEGEFSNTSGATECIRCPVYYWSNVERVACVAGIEEFLSFQEIMGIVLVTLSLLGVAAATAVSVIFFLFRATPIVKANNSELSFLLLLSLKLCFLCSLVFMGRPSLWSCQARQAAFGISFVLCISCILVKTIVVLLAFRSTMPGSSSLKRFGPPQQRAFIVGCTAGQVILCMSWLALAPPYPYKNTSYQGGKIVLECKDVWPLGFYLVLGYIGLLSCVCFILAFLCRKLPDTFNEAKLITFSMLIFFAVWISFIPAYNSSPGKYTVAVEIFAILASAFGLLFCIFAPKCYIILLRPDLNTKKGMTGKTGK